MLKKSMLLSLLLFSNLHPAQETNPLVILSVHWVDDALQIEFHDKVIVVDRDLIDKELLNLSGSSIKFHLRKNNILLKEIKGNNGEVYYALHDGYHGMGGNWVIKHLVKVALGCFTVRELSKFNDWFEQRKKEGKTTDRGAIVGYMQWVYDNVLYNGIGVNLLNQLSSSTTDLNNLNLMTDTLINYNQQIKDEVVMQLTENYNKEKEETKAVPIGFAWATRAPGTPEYNQLVKDVMKYGRTAEQAAKWLR